MSCSDLGSQFYTNGGCSYDMYSDINEKLARIAGIEYDDNYVSGLPVGLELPNGVTIGAKL